MAVTQQSSLFAVLRTASCLESRVEARLADIGLSLPKLAALQRLTQAGESLPLGQLAEKLACVKSNVTQLVDRLEADGLVARTADPNDGRSRIAVLTAAGRRAFARGIGIQRQAEQELFSVLTPDESDHLHRLLAKLDAH
ncbi:MAG: MarR family transcriptional regulator [Acidobacteriia bacterium]|nr:MarR family transcriptional regulator [Terriglobia bacterium]